MFGKIQQFWKRHEYILRFYLLLLGLMAIVVETFWPMQFMLEWREVYDPNSWPLVFLIPLIVLGSMVLLFFKVFRRPNDLKNRVRITEWTLVMLFFVMSISGAPLVWSVGQSIALGVGLSSVYR
jgi:hypothetical protein